ncbi:MAG: hypothetical protein WA766_11660 [Candidatus Acidiferrales bacterium]
MAQRIINKSVVNYQQPPIFGTPIAGSTDDMYPEMEAFDMREQFNYIMNGNYEEPGVGRAAIYRKLSNTKCRCYQNLEGSPDPNCVYCNGEGYLFTEEIKQMYFAKNFGSVLGSSTQIQQQSQLTEAGYFDSNRCVAYMFWYDILDYERYSIPTRPAPDKIFELKTLPDGTMDPNLIRTEEWRVRSATAQHGTNGRVEYFEIGLEKVSV